MEYWSSREFADVLGYGDYRNFEGVVEKAKMACFNSGHRLEDHSVDITEMILIGKGGQRSVKTILLSRYACYLAIQNADPNKEIVAQGQTYFAIQTRRQELADEHTEEKRLLLRFGLQSPQTSHRHSTVAQASKKSARTSCWFCGGGLRTCFGCGSDALQPKEPENAPQWILILVVS